MKKLLLFISLLSFTYALTPFSLEGLKEFNVKVWNKNDLLTQAQADELKLKIEEKLTPLGLKLHSKTFSNMLVKLEGVEVDETTVVNVTIAIIEDAHPARDKEMINMTMTYTINDLFDSTDVVSDIYESVLSYLLEDFIEQYKNEN